MIYSASERPRSTRLAATESENRLEMPSWRRAQDTVCRTCEKLRDMDTFRWWRQRSLLILSVAIMAIRSATHSINQTDCRFVYPPGLGTGLKKQYLPQPAVHFPSVFPQPRLISAFQLFLIRLLRCPPHKEFLDKFYLCTLSAISAPEPWLCVLSLIQSLSAFPGRAQRKLLI